MIHDTCTTDIQQEIAIPLLFRNWDAPDYHDTDVRCFRMSVLYHLFFVCPSHLQCSLLLLMFISSFFFLHS